MEEMLPFITFCFGWGCGSFFNWFLDWVDEEPSELF